MIKIQLPYYKLPLNNSSQYPDTNQLVYQFSYIICDHIRLYIEISGSLITDSHESGYMGGRYDLRLTWGSFKPYLFDKFKSVVFYRECFRFSFDDPADEAFFLLLTTNENDHIFEIDQYRIR